MPDTIRFYHNGLDFEATDEDFKLLAGEFRTAEQQGHYAQSLRECFPIGIPRIRQPNRTSTLSLRRTKAMDIPLYHVTLNTGHAALHAPGRITPACYSALWPLIAGGGGTIPSVAPWRSEIIYGREEGFALFDIKRGSDPPAIVCGVAWTNEGSDALWPIMADLVERAPKISEHPPVPKPPRIPWVACVLFDSLALSAPSDVAWMGDAERCLAAAAITLPEHMAPEIPEDEP